MKKSICVLLACITFPAWSLDWKLPVFTVRYEAAGGAAEDPDDETFLASSLRNTVTFQVKETADPAAFGLAVTLSGKDYYLPADQSGDYSYARVEQTGAIRIGDAWKLGYDFNMKAMDYASLDSQCLSKDVLTTGVGGTASLLVVKGTSLEAGITGRYAAAGNPADSLVTGVVTAGFSSRLGEWLLSARYRGELRFPLDPSQGTDAYNTAGVSLQWDPNR
jgi:hypothetical protein